MSTWRNQTEKGRRQFVSWCALLITWLLLAGLLGGYTRLYSDFVDLVRGPLPSITALQGHGAADLPGILTLTGLGMLWITLTHVFSTRRGTDKLSKLAHQKIDFARLSQSVVFVNVCLTILAYTIIAILRHRAPSQALTQQWLWLATLLASSVAVPWACVAWLFWTVTNSAHTKVGGEHGALPMKTPISLTIPIRFALSALFRIYVILRYGFVLACLYETLIAAAAFYEVSLLPGQATAFGRTQKPEADTPGR